MASVSINNQLAKQHQVDVIKHLCCVWMLTKALAVEADYLREYMAPEYRKMLSDVKAKANFFCKSTSKSMQSGELDNVDEDAAKALELVWDYTVELFNKK